MRKSQTFEVKSKQLHSFLHLALMAANPQSTQGTTYVGTSYDDSTDEEEHEQQGITPGNTMKYTSEDQCKAYHVMAQIEVARQSMEDLLLQDSEAVKVTRSLQTESERLEADQKAFEAKTNNEFAEVLHQNRQIHDLETRALHDAEQKVERMRLNLERMRSNLKRLEADHKEQEDIMKRTKRHQMEEFRHRHRHIATKMADTKRKRLPTLEGRQMELHDKKCMVDEMVGKWKFDYCVDQCTQTYNAFHALQRHVTSQCLLSYSLVICTCAALASSTRSNSFSAISM